MTRPRAFHFYAGMCESICYTCIFRFTIAIENMNNHTPSAMRRVAVIGSGISGIAASVMLQKTGFQVDIFEKSDTIGGVWALAYPNVRLQNIAPHYHISDFPWPFKPDRHPTGTQIMRYLEAAVAHFKLKTHLQHRVADMQQTSGGWLLGIESPQGYEQWHFDYVMVSNGHYSDGKNRPAFPGENTFRGRVITEREVRSMDIFQNKRVAVVGFGKSAVDMADFAANNHAAQVYHVFRTARWMIPRKILGLHFTKLLFNRFGSVMMTSWSHPSAFERWMHRKSAGVINAFWKKIQGVFKTHILHAGKGLEAQKRLQIVVPAHDLKGDLRSAACLEPETYYRKVAEGRILPYHSELESFIPNGLHLKNGQVIDCDLVVLSLGSQTPAFPFMPAELRKMLESEPDGVQLYRHLIHPDIPNVGFAGFNHCYMHVPAVEVGTLWLAALWRGELALPTRAVMQESMNHMRDWKRAHIHFEPSRSCGVSTRFQQYLDILLKDLHISPYRKMPNVVAEVFARYKAADYAHVWQDYQRRRRNGRVLRPSEATH